MDCKPMRPALQGLSRYLLLLLCRKWLNPILIWFPVHPRYWHTCIELSATRKQTCITSGCVLKTYIKTLLQRQINGYKGRNAFIWLRSFVTLGAPIHKQAILHTVCTSGAVGASHISSAKVFHERYAYMPVGPVMRNM